MQHTSTLQQNKLRRAYAAGVWDFLHAGHLRLLERARAMCDELIVGVCTDEHTESYKVRPYQSEQQRMEAIIQTGLAKHVFLVNSDHASVYQKYGITHLIHGDDWEREEYIRFMGAEAIAQHSIEVHLLPHTPGISSTLLRAQTTELRTK